jgi:hypothetical protein
MDTKTCNLCAKCKPTGDFYLKNAKNPKLGFRSTCKACCRNLDKEYRNLKSQNKPTRKDRFKTEDPNIKKCNTCGREKPMSAFFYEGSKNKPKARCKSCNRKKRIDARSKKLGREWRLKDKYKCDIEGHKVCTKCMSAKKYEEFNVNRSGPKEGKLFSICKECDLAKYNKLRIKNKKKDAKKRKERYRTDKNHRLRLCIRRRIQMAVKHNAKSASTFDLLGCTIPEYKTYLESKFKTGMTWDNYGRYGWHIDHVKPCAMFDLSDKEQQKECFHYSNTQPLWQSENHRKGAKYKCVN